MKPEAEAGAICLQTEQSQNLPATAGSVKARQASSPEALEGARPCFQTLASSTLREDISVVPKRLSCNSVLCQPQETNTAVFEKE